MRACNFKGCGRPHVAKGLCETHYKQYRAGRELTHIRVYKKNAEAEDGRECSVCGEYKTWTNYYRLSKDTHRHEAKCKDCRKTRRKA